MNFGLNESLLGLRGRERRSPRAVSASKVLRFCFVFYCKCFSLYSLEVISFLLSRPQLKTERHLPTTVDVFSPAATDKDRCCARFLTFGLDLFVTLDAFDLASVLGFFAHKFAHGYMSLHLLSSPSAGANYRAPNSGFLWELKNNYNNT